MWRSPILQVAYWVEEIKSSFSALGYTYLHLIFGTRMLILILKKLAGVIVRLASWKTLLQQFEFSYLVCFVPKDKKLPFPSTCLKIVLSGCPVINMLVWQMCFIVELLIMCIYLFTNRNVDQFCAVYSVQNMFNVWHLSCFCVVLGTALMPGKGAPTN